MSAPCPFCSPDPARVFHHAGKTVLGLWDGMPASKGHALLVTRRHVASWFEASQEERTELMDAVQIAREQIERDHRPDGYNVGMNLGAVAGQTVFHLHVHVIPRYLGDHPAPQGGIRHAVADGLGYPLPSSAGAAADPPVGEAVSDTLVAGSRLWSPVSGVPHRRALISGGSDPLLAHVPLGGAISRWMATRRCQGDGGR